MPEIGTIVVKEAGEEKADGASILGEFALVERCKGESGAAAAGPKVLTLLAAVVCSSDDKCLGVSALDVDVDKR